MKIAYRESHYKKVFPFSIDIKNVKLNSGSDGMTKLKLQHIQKHFGKVNAVNDFSLRLNEKAFVVLAGPSGCGKTTLLQLIAGLLPVDSGRIILNDSDITEVEPGKRKIAMVFQDAALFPHLNVYENIAFGLAHQGMKEKDIPLAVHHMAKMLSIDELLDRLANTLSGGQMQRVAIARALIRQPGLFLMDEPLSSLDASLKSKLRVEIAQLYQQQNATFLYVTHDQMEAMTLATVLIIMKDGVIQQVGKPRDLYHDPCNLFVAKFLGRYGINQIQGRIQNHTLYCMQKRKPLDFQIEDQDIYVCIRPQDIYEDAQGESGRIVLIEDIGDEIYYHVLVNGTTIIMKQTHIREYQMNEEIQIGFHWVDALYFNSNTEERVHIG